MIAEAKVFLGHWILKAFSYKIMGSGEINFYFIPNEIDFDELKLRIENMKGNEVEFHIRSDSCSGRSYKKYRGVLRNKIRMTKDSGSTVISIHGGTYWGKS